jgi:hypothetical protein
VHRDMFFVGSTDQRTGGAANTYTPSEKETLDARRNNEQVRRSSFQKSKDRAEAGLKDLRDKAKAAVTGKDNEKSESATS